MTEQQIWFLLIFTIPFIPATVVFLFIRPQAGDAKVGGSIPIFKDLKLDLGGAIATYVVIVIFALVAYWLITKKQVVAFEVRPVTESGEIVEPNSVDWRNLDVPQLEVHAGTIKNGVNDLALDEEKHLFVNPKGDYFSADLIGSNVVFDILASRTNLAESTENVLGSKIRLDMKIKDSALYGWLGRFDRTAFLFSPNEKKYMASRLFFLTNIGKNNTGRIELSPWAARGLASLTMRVYRVNENTLTDALTEFGQINKSEDNRQYGTRVDAWAKNLLKTSSLIGSASWQRAGEAPKELIVGDDTAKIYAAPTPRVDAIPGGVKAGDTIGIGVEASGDLEQNWKADYSSLVTLYSHPTELSLVIAQVDQGATFCTRARDVMIDGPSGSRSLPTSAV